MSQYLFFFFFLILSTQSNIFIFPTGLKVNYQSINAPKLASYN